MRSTLFAAPLGFALVAALMAAAPAAANSAEACSTAPAKLRAMATTQDAEVQRKAVRNISLGESLCEARNRSEAAKKFNLAAKAMGTDLATVMASGATASVQ